MDRNDVQMPLLALAVWLRYSSARFLCWNKNYNVKPREISAAQDRLTQTITKVWVCGWVWLGGAMIERCMIICTYD